MQQICKLEGITAADEVLEELYLTRFGDLRNAIGRLGELANVSKTITAEMLEGSPVDFDVFDTFYSLAEKGQIRKAYRHFLKSRIDGGFTQEDFAATFAKRLLSLKVDDTIKSKVFVFIKENRIGNDSDVGVLALASKIYLSALEFKKDEKAASEMATIEKAIADFYALTHKFETFAEMLARVEARIDGMENDGPNTGPPEPL
jgi:hypothetical protein